MQPINQAETRTNLATLQQGDIVRLIQPFKPDPGASQEYRFGLVVGLNRCSFEDMGAVPEPERSRRSRYPVGKRMEVILHLYDPVTATTYVDDRQAGALFSFYLHEVACIGDL
ncbi:hypothetical protein BST81_15710 [Leptolyngbya sp. 'hensonii']|uniref:hypothetical protein n=1 Tax=Leptolyngbya sp. 'hensonii' TaxID=1922337 RepID=UPI00094FA05B|nr:hypothetical protein [Leptolyngbya sp. 'hensonii']OLP17264.1 hypothetical protein BST81_15710 [Leptolyngbya sp. 'hensonii']